MEGLLGLPVSPILTCDGPKVDVTFVLANGEGYDVLRAIAMEMHRTELLDALSGQHTNPASCRAARDLRPRHLNLGPRSPIHISLALMNLLSVLSH